MALDDPLMSHNWVITNAGTAEQYFSSKPGFFRDYTESIELPFRQFTADDRHVATTKKYYAGFNNVNSFSAVFYEDVNATTISGFVNWQNQIMDKDFNYNPANRYKTDWKVKLVNDKLGPNSPAIVQAQLLGVFPLAMNPLSLTSGVEFVPIAVTFSVDRVIWSGGTIQPQ